MRALFVHGMGRSPVSGWPLVWNLKHAGVHASTFGYSTTMDGFFAIRDRLALRIALLAKQGPYFLVGHSLGGVLIRAALASLPSGVPRPRHLFLLGSPVHASRLARRLARNRVYRVFTGDSGQLLASESRMAAIGPPGIPTTAIVGTQSLPFALDPFPNEVSDGVVMLSETDAVWLADRVPVRLIHTLLPSSPKVSEIILRTLAARTD